MSIKRLLVLTTDCEQILKTKIFLVLALLLFPSLAQAASNVSVYTPQPTIGQPWFALKGFPHNHWVQVYTDQAAAPLTWNINGSNIATVTVANSFTAGDIVQPQQFAASGNGQMNERLFFLNTATSSLFTFGNLFASATGGAEVSPTVVHKLNGTQTGTWSWVNTGTTTASVTLTSLDGNRTNTGTSALLTGEQPFVNIVFNTDGNCTETGTSGSYATTSTVKGNLVFTADADPTKTASFPYVVCAPGGNSGKLAMVYAMTGYRQAFKGETVDLLARVRGNSNRAVTWTMTNSPSGGDGFLENAGFPEAQFHTGTVAGQYEFTATASADATATDKAVVYVASQTRAAANPDMTEQVPCEDDPGAGFVVMQVGPTKTYHDIKSLPLNALTGPTLVQIFNEGAAGSPTTYSNFTQVMVDPANVTRTVDVHHPLLVQCRVPNATSGEYPIEDGTNATGPAWVQDAFSGASMWFISNQSANAVYHHAPLPVRYVSNTNAHVQNVTFGVPFTDAAGNAHTWGDSSAIRFYNCEYCADIGMWTYNVAIPAFVDANSANNNWGGGSFHIIHEGGNLQLSGADGRSTEHPLYTQGQDDVIRKMFIQGVVPNAQGNVCWSSRAGTLIAEYNRCVSAPGADGGSQMHGQGEVQNFPRYLIASETNGSYSYFGAPGDLGCGSPFCNGDEWGPNGLAALIEEHYQTALVFGNTFYVTNGEKTYGTTNTNGNDNQIDGPVRSEVYYNTYAIKASTYFGHYKQGYAEETRIGSPGNGNPDPRPVIWPTMNLANNIFPWTSNTSCSNQSSQLCYTFTSQDTDFIEFSGKNLVASGQVTVGTVNQGYNSGEFRSGMASDMVDMDYSINSLNYRWKGFTSGNFPTYSIYPIDPTTFKPISGSMAIGIATPLTSLQALYPPRWNSVSSTGVMTRRTDLTTVGAQDPTGGPAPPSNFGAGVIFGSGLLR